MSNERRFLPLHWYEVEYQQYIGNENTNFTDTFTADYHKTENGITYFYNTGNIIREYHIPLVMITITPKDD